LLRQPFFELFLVYLAFRGETTFLEIVPIEGLAIVEDVVERTEQFDQLGILEFLWFLDLSVLICNSVPCPDLVDGELNFLDLLFE
jgi:hypothetical protein